MTRIGGNPNISKVNFSSKTKEELSKMNSVSGKKSEGAKKRWFRSKNPDIAALMAIYKSGNQVECMNKYMIDNDKFMLLFKESTTVEGKRKVLRDYQTFQLKMHELMFGNKLSVDANINVDVVNREHVWRDMALRGIEHYHLEKVHKTWIKKFGKVQADEMYQAINYKYHMERAVLQRHVDTVKQALGRKEDQKEHDIEFEYTDEEYEEVKKEIDIDKLGQTPIKQNKKEVE